MDAERLQALLDAREGDGRVTVLTVVPISGGYSRSTARAQLRWADGTEESVVLRGDPLDEKAIFRSDRQREWDVLTALYGAGACSIPRPRWFDATGEFMGSPCIVSDAIPGASLFSLLSPSAPIDGHRAEFVATMAAVHTTPVSCVAEALDVPPSWEAHMESFAERYEQMIASCGDTDPVLTYVLAKYRQYRPAPLPLALVHGDWQPGNVLVDEDGSHVVIDWEFTHVGDPREDFGYLMMLPFDPDLYYDDAEAFCEEYRNQTGVSEADINPELLEYFKLVGFLTVHEQALAGLDEVARGQDKGALGPYLVNTATHFAHLLFDVARGLPVMASEEAAR